ncbi:MAG: type II toxin-antitoxin system RelE/ParE family toxin [Chloroflexota bacterium]|nr:type II toxin-antitoxin system RelE/ParE family toxin [Chloroflexota bacterium]
MAWTIEYSRAASRQLRKLDRHTVQRVLDYMNERVAVLDDPRSRGKAMSGHYSGYWRYRVGDHRVICDIQNNALCILVLRVGRRDKVYR